jgi:translation initiation factor 1
MNKKKKEIQLNWDDFVKMGNPENAPVNEEEEQEIKTDEEKRKAAMQVRVHYERKGRGGKEAMIIRGIATDEQTLQSLCSKLKSKLGIGGTAKDGEIILQGNKREKTRDLLLEFGYKQVKLAGG